MFEKNLIGKVSATEKQPTTVDEFVFWIQDNTLVKPFDIVRVDHYKQSVTYGVIEEIWHTTDSPGHLGSYVSSDFGDVASKPQTLRLRLSAAKCKVLSNHPKNGNEAEQIYMPIQDGSRVYFANESEIIEALGLKSIENPIPAGFIETSNASVPINFNKDFMIGPEGAHLNISGISGLATKTSYAMFLLQALQQKQKDIAIIVLNVKGTDLLRLDEENPNLDDKDRNEYKKSGLECKPFERATYFYPYQKNEDKFYSNTYLSKEVLEEQHNRDCAFNYIYTYENDRENLDLLFSNIDDPNQTIESILNEIVESSEFEGLDWDSFRDEIREYTQKGHSKSKDISIASWRKFSRLIKKSTKNDIFQQCKGLKNKRHVHLQDKIQNIKMGDTFVIDIAKLDEQLQCFVFGDIIKAVYDLKLGETERDEKDIPKQIVIFVDELNKYAASSAPKNSPILNVILEITERGRSMGVILFSAEQFKSAIHDRAKGNCSTHVYGRTNAIEISKPDYRFIPKVFTNMMTRLSKGELIIEHPIFRTLLKIKFPFPSYHQNQEKE
ncbi:ATP-binding protein [Candidatus Parabeggiatoa sp. HSG14]|uniref:ATP-binding protein n=1 Tax=Candidatus Parabeggiatoa sp. HSG14 TaxID=3055593 RepID=UPI0025A87762|nr:ATP-binding protein [Thiotrichales bacterium HSG14]